MSNFNFFNYLLENFSRFLKRLQVSFLALILPEKRRRHPAKPLGFTLIEVLVVMIMVGILSAIAAPSWLGFVNNQRINTSQNRIFQALKVAQADAKIRNTSNTNRVRITFATGQTTNAYRIDNVRTGAGNQSLEPGVTISGVTMSGITPPGGIPPGNAGPPYIEFDPNGRLYDPNNQLTYPICINLSIANSPRVRWIAIKTLLGAINTGSEGSCN